MRASVTCGFRRSVHSRVCWQKLKDDPVKMSNKRGYVSFATSGKDSRTTQMFINFKDNTNLDGMGFAPFAKVVDGMDVVDRIYKGYGEGAPSGKVRLDGTTIAVIHLTSCGVHGRDLPKAASSRRVTATSSATSPGFPT